GADDADVAVDLAGRPNPALSLDGHAGVYHRVGADFDVRIDVGRGRVDDGDAGCHQFFVFCLSHDSAHFREFGAAVDPPDFLGIVDNERFDRQLPPAVDGNQVGQVVLALGVLRGDSAQRVEQRRQVEGVDTAVDLSNLTHVRRRVTLLDDPGDASPRANDAPVAVGPFDDGRHDGCGGVGGLMCLDQPAQRGALEEGNVARQKDQGPLFSGKPRLGLLEGVGGSELRLLHHEAKVWAIAYGSAYRFGAVADA